MTAAARHLVLASRSPRRAELLKTLGYNFDTAAADIDEQPLADEVGADFAVRMAREKAAAVAAGRPDALVLAADTDIELDGVILGKPRDEAHCIAMLTAMSDRDHWVHTALCARCDGDVRSALVSTRVSFGAVTAAAARRYWHSGEPRDKAGAYAIQGFAARWVRRIEGSYSGVIGLPLYETAALLTAFECEGAAA